MRIYTQATFAYTFAHILLSHLVITHTSCSVSVIAEMCIDIWKLVSMRWGGLRGAKWKNLSYFLSVFLGDLKR